MVRWTTESEDTNMKDKINVSISVFEKNFKMAKHAYTLNSSMEAAGCASAFIGDTEPVSEDQFLRAKLIVKKNTKILSTLGHGNARQIVAAAVSTSVDPEKAMKKIAEIHRKLDKKFFNSDYLVLSAVMIYKNVSEDRYEEVIDRTRKIYSLMRKDHPMITGREDLINVTLMALTNVAVEAITYRCEQDFQALKKHYHLKNNIQYLAGMLSIFDGAPDELAEGAKETQKNLKEHGVRFDAYGLPIIGAISALISKADRDLVCRQISEVSDRLKSIRGMGSWGAGKRIRNMIATAIVIDAYAEDKDSRIRASVSAAIVSAIIAAEMAAIVAASAAASSAAASSS